MDIVYLAAAGTLWAAVVALTLGCEHLQPHEAAP